MEKTKNILKEVGVMFIATLFLLTALFVFTPMTNAVTVETTVFSYEFEVTDWTFVQSPNPGNNIGVSMTSAHTGIRSCAFSSWYPSVSYDEYLISKLLTTVSGDQTMSFWYRSAGWWETFTVGWSTTGNNVATDFTWSAPINTNITTWTQYINEGLPVGTKYVAIHYYSVYRWYFYVDDFTLPGGVTQGFEVTSDVPVYWPDWTSHVITGHSMYNKWYGQQTGTYPTCSPHSGSWMAQYQSRYATTGKSARLEYNTPFDFGAMTGYDFFTLTFWMYHDTGYSECNDRVSVQIKNDSTWVTPLGGTFNRYDGTTGWKEHSVNLSAYKDETSVYIGFLAESFNGNNMYIDDVKIIGYYDTPSISIEVPTPGLALQDGVTFRSLVTDSCGIDWVKYSIRTPGGIYGTIINPANESILATQITGNKWQLPFDTTLLPDGYYILYVNARDMCGHEGNKTVAFSICNWAVLEMLPNTENSKAGRTMPIKFSLRVAHAVDPAEPFVWNEELTIKIYVKGFPGTILQTSIYGSDSTNYRIDILGEKYITNFKTLKNPNIYVVEILGNDNILLGSFEFQTVK